MFISTRKFFSPQEPDWQGYKEFIKLALPDELFTIDSYLNAYVDNCGAYLIDDLNQLDSVLEMLPRPDPQNNQYYQLAINVSKEPLPTLDSNMTQLGHDISDATSTSSFLNCGPWKGPLAEIARRINGYGLLSLEDAELARTLLPQVWGEAEHHSHVDIWLVCRLDRA